jgi:hypothetical protein
MPKGGGLTADVSLRERQENHNGRGEDGECFSQGRSIAMQEEEPLSLNCRPLVWLAEERGDGLGCCVVLWLLRRAHVPVHHTAKGRRLVPPPESTLARVEKRPVGTRAPPEHQSTRVPEHQNTRAPEHQSTRTPEHQNTRAPEHQNTRPRSPTPSGKTLGSSSRSRNDSYPRTIPRSMNAKQKSHQSEEAT